MVRKGRTQGFKHNKVIICLIESLIVLMTVGFIFKLSLTNTETDEIRLTPNKTLSCQLCSAENAFQQGDYCCDSTEGGECINAKSKQQCKTEILAVKNEEAQFYQDNLITLIILGSAFFLIECCCDSCLNFTVTQLSFKTRNDDYSRLLKSGAISTLNLEQGSSATSFSSLSDSVEGKSDLQKSFCYQMEEMACPVCLQTLEEQRVVFLGCRHIMHSSCARISHSNCPICA